jgi:hypothetical protein
MSRDPTPSKNYALVPVVCNCFFIIAKFVHPSSVLVKLKLSCSLLTIKETIKKKKKNHHCIPHIFLNWLITLNYSLPNILFSRTTDVQLAPEFWGEQSCYQALI